MKTMVDNVAAVYVLLSCFFMVIVRARCPNGCSGHGTCGKQNVCECFHGWTGGAADCSSRTCPSGVAWADKAYSSDKAHQETECSNAGICDRSSGTCKCFNSFTGNACQRSLCPNGCSGRGTCSSIGDVSYYLGPDYDPTASYPLSGDGFGPIYQNWDKDAIHLCECSRGFFGADCSLKMCPKGDDPLTVDQNYRAIKLHVQNYGATTLLGKLGLVFMGATTEVSLDSTSSAQCTDELAFRGGFGHLTCKYEVIDDFTVQYSLVFYSWPLTPTENNLFSHDGNPSIHDFYCDVSMVEYGRPMCTFTDITNSNIREYAYCSNRGLCDFKKGDCNCGTGFGGPACSNVTSLYNDDDGGANAMPGLQVNVNGNHYSATAVQITSMKSKAPDFNFIEAIAGGEVVFYVRGDGLLEVNKLNTLSGGHTISNGGLFVERGGITVANTGINIESVDSVVPVAMLTSGYRGALGTKYAAIRISSQSSTPSQMRAIEVLHEGRRVFAVRGDGAMLVYKMGAFVTGGITVSSGGLSVTGGATINSGGLQILQSGLVATGGLTVNSNGIKVLNGGAQIFSGGGSIYSGGLVIVGGGQTILAGGLSVSGGMTIGSYGLMVTGGVTIGSKGLVVTGGMTIRSGGLSVTEGFTIYNGGMRITGGMTVLGGGLFVTNGLTVANSGLYLGSGNLVVNGGGIVATGGLTVNSNGLIVTGGITSNTGGMQITGGLSVMDTGVFVTGGLTLDGVFSGASYGVYVKWGGLAVQSGGVSINGNAGLSVLNGVTIGSGGLNVAGPSTFSNDMTVSGGMLIMGGLTVQGVTRLNSAAVVYSDRQLKTNLLPITGALDKVSRLQGVYFDWIKHERTGLEFDEKRHVGVIAQNVLEVLPEAVDRKDGGSYLGVDYSAMVPLLIEAIHDLEDQIEDLSATRNAKEGLTIDKVWSQLQSLQEEVRGLRDQNQWLQTEINQRRRELDELRKAKS